MTYTQTVNPNLATVGNIGWCLSFVEDVFSTPHSFATATDAWQATRSPHKDRNLPSDVSVPVWFSYFESGLNFGHVAVNVPGRGVLSSPYKADGTSQWFSSIDQCAQVLNCTYLGWSEDLAGVQIVKGANMLTKEEIIVIYTLAFDDNDVDVPADIISAYTGKPLDGLLTQLASDPTYLAHKKAVNNPSGVKPYSGPQLFTKS